MTTDPDLAWRIAEITAEHHLPNNGETDANEGTPCACGALIEDWDLHWAETTLEALTTLGHEVVQQGEINGLKTRTGLAETILREQLDPSHCHHDHHGQCQAHGYLADGSCMQIRIREFLNMPQVGPK